MRYRFRCEYLGSAFYGWQAQNEGGKTKFVTVQSALEEALAIALRSPMRITGSASVSTLTMTVKLTARGWNAPLMG